MSKYAILVEGRFNHYWAKTGAAMLRYKPHEVVCCVDSVNAGRTTADVLNIGGNIPIVKDVKTALVYHPDTLLIGVVTEGGYLPADMRSGVKTAIRNGLNIVCGLHHFLADDKEFSSLAKKHDTELIDLRKPSSPLPFTKGSWRSRKTPVLLTVGTDCDSGKMTAAWELVSELQKNNIRAKFIGTGQTGKLLSGNGVAIDAVVSDFVAGVVEDEIDKVDHNLDLIVVEGQGSLTHMAYSGVTLGLVHGAMPDFLLMCHEPARKADLYEHPIYPLVKTMNLYSTMVEVFKPCSFVGVSLITASESEHQAKKTIKKIRSETGLPAEDMIRFKDGSIVLSVLDFLGKKKN